MAELQTQVGIPEGSSPDAGVGALAVRVRTWLGLGGDWGGRSLRSRAVRASAWTIGGYWTSTALRLGSNLILAQLLVPEMFGLMTLVTVLMQGLAMFSDIGIGPSIIREKRGEDPDFLNTAWTMQVLRGGVLGGIAAGLALPYAMFYNSPELFGLVLVTALNPLIAGFNSTKLFTYSRKLEVPRPLLMQLFGQFMTTAVMIGWALVSPTVWALVAGGLTGTVIRLVLSHTALEGTPNRFRWDPASRAALFTFGRWILLSTALTFLAGQGDRLLFGKLITIEELGVYGIALIIAGTATQMVLQLGSAIVFPVYSTLLNQQRDIRPLFSRVRQPLMLGAGGIVACLVAGGEPLIRVLYPSAYHNAGWMVQVLAVGAWFQVMSVSTGSALLALGHSKATATGNLVKLIGLGVAVPSGWYLGGLQGAPMQGALWGLVGSEVAKYLVLAGIARRVGLRGLAQEAVLSTVLALSAGGGVLLAGQLEAAGLHDVAIGAVIGGLMGATWGTAAAVTLRRRGGAVAAGPKAETETA